MKLICPDCGMQYESGKFCLECGTKLQEAVPELVCTSCGYRAKTGKFCPECGNKLIEQLATSNAMESSKSKERSFNERDARFTKYYDKKGFPRRIPQEERDVAIEELTPFADQNIAEAKMLLGGIFMNSSDKALELKGVTLLKEAEAAGDKLAYYVVGICYFTGAAEPLIKENHDEAEKRLLEAYNEYENGEFAMFLAQLYTFSTQKVDYKKAFDYATIAADEDETYGYYVLGKLYKDGLGVNKNANLALENFKMAAADGDEIAMNQIGYIYMGDEGIDANPEQSFYWFNEAAKKGSDVSLYNLGYCYQNGFGVDADIEKAAECYKKAAEMGLVDAMLELGQYYQSTLIDLDKAKMWLTKAAELGHPEAQKELTELESNATNVEDDNEIAVPPEIPEEYVAPTAQISNVWVDCDGVKTVQVHCDWTAKNLDGEFLTFSVNYVARDGKFKSNVDYFEVAGNNVQFNNTCINLSDLDLGLKHNEETEIEFIIEIVKFYEDGDFESLFSTEKMTFKVWHYFNIFSSNKLEIRSQKCLP